MKPETGQYWTLSWSPEFGNDEIGAQMRTDFLKQNPDGKYHWIKKIKVHSNGMIQHGTELMDEETFIKKCVPHEK